MNFEDEYLKLGYTAEEAEEAAEQQVNIQKSFAESYVNDYLKPRFDESRSMNEFVEYLDVRQEEQNPFQTQSMLKRCKPSWRATSKGISRSNQRYCS